MLIISAHLPHARQSVLSYSETLQEITCCLERFKSAFLRHHVVLGADCNVSLNGFEDGRFVGDATVPLTKVRSSADAERASALCEFMLNFGLRADNTWSEWDCVTRVGWRHESRESRYSSQVCDSDHLTPCALRWTANDPVAWEKAVGGSSAIVSFGGDDGLSLDRDKWFFCGKHVRRNDLRCNGSVAITSTGSGFSGRNLRRRPSEVSAQTFLRSLFQPSAGCS